MRGWLDGWTAGPLECVGKLGIHVEEVHENDAKPVETRIVSGVRSGPTCRNLSKMIKMGLWLGLVVESTQIDPTCGGYVDQKRRKQKDIGTVALVPNSPKNRFNDFRIPGASWVKRSPFLPTSPSLLTFFQAKFHQFSQPHHHHLFPACWPPAFSRGIPFLDLDFPGTRTRRWRVPRT